MGHVGLYGDIAFVVADNGKGGIKALSFHDLNVTAGANYEEHAQPQKQPKLEYTGLTAQESKYDIELSSALGYDPWTEYQKLMKIMQSGEAYPFVIGGRLIGSYKWVITNISNDITRTWIDGRMMRMTLQISMKEDVAPSQRNANFGKNVQVPPVSEKQPETGERTYTVVKGDCLWKIAKQFYGKGSEYPKIANANKDIIKKPNLIHPGDVLRIPA